MMLDRRLAAEAITMTDLTVSNLHIRGKTFLAMPEEERKRRYRFINGLATAVSALVAFIAVLAVSTITVLLGAT